MAESPFNIGTENTVKSTIRSRSAIEGRLDKHNKTLKMIRNGTMESMINPATQQRFTKVECMLAEKEIKKLIEFYEDLVETM